ncbi:MAG: hypothetical protein R8G01_14685 [Ilumatobacteraceae bacterium]|nr:hypothetical protein [Ilumatobacteraceae bacterium]
MEVWIQTFDPIMEARMKRSATRTLFGGATVALAAAGCGGSEADSSSDANSATQFFLDFADVAGVELDRSCVEDAVETLSPEDTKILADAPAASMELIASAPFNDAIEAVGERIFDDCVTPELDE